MEFLRELITKVRGTLGLGFLGSIGGVVVTVLRATLASWATYGLWPLPIEVSMAATAGALGGFVFGSSCGVALAVLSKRRSLEELSLRRVAAIGLAVGAAVPAALTLLVSGADIFLATLPSVVTASTAWAVFGGLLAPVSVVAARRAERIEFESGRRVPRLASIDQ